jgi:hypothetical protein
MNLPSGWHNGTTGTCTFYCNADGNATGTVDGVALTISYYGTATIPIASTINGYSLPVTLSIAATCGVNW